jgi:hypothetical protein
MVNDADALLVVGSSLMVYSGFRFVEGEFHLIRQQLVSRKRIKAVALSITAVTHTSAIAQTALHWHAVTSLNNAASAYCYCVHRAICYTTKPAAVKAGKSVAVLNQGYTRAEKANLPILKIDAGCSQTLRAVADSLAAQ